MDPLVSPLWKRLDVPGHDACVIEAVPGGWRMTGQAVFLDPAGPAALRYIVECDSGWISRVGRIEGHIGARPFEAAIRNRDGRWFLDGEPAPAVEGRFDLDLGFTPATNFLHLRRENLAVGETRDIDVAWFDVDQPLTCLPQTYERLTETTYRYASPTAGYEAVLEMGPNGIVTHYPTLWRAEP